jgi:hypothetical protein
MVWQLVLGRLDEEGVAGCRDRDDAASVDAEAGGVARGSYFAACAVCAPNITLK